MVKIKMRIKFAAAALVFASAFFAPAAVFAQQAPIFFDAFLLDNNGQPAQNFNTFFLWDVTDGSVDLVGGNVPGAVDQTNGRFVELGGSTGDAGQFATRVPIPFLPGVKYRLSFDYKSSDGNLNSAQVSVGSQVFNVSTDSTALLSFSRVLRFDAPVNERLVFQNLEDDDSGIGIDNVIVVEIPPTAAAVQVGGRVTSASGRGIGSALVRMVDGDGNARTSKTSAFGYYSFAEVAAGATYVFTATAKNHRFAEPTQVQSIQSETRDINFASSNQ